MVTVIFVRGWFILMTTVNVLSIDAQYQNLTKCLSERDKCYTLYRADLTWQEAYDECLSRNQNLATIQDAQTQSIMQQFATDKVYTEGAAHAWVAGRRRNDTTWRYLNGTAFNHTGKISSGGDSNRLCMSLNGESGLSPKDDLHRAVPCNSSTLYMAVCEYDPPDGGCPDDDFTILQPSVNKCNTVSDKRYRSWQDARQYCQNHSWELAHTGAGSWDFYNQLTEPENPSIGHLGPLWIGVQREPWVWIIGTDKKYVSEFHWRDDEGFSCKDDCIQIELNKEGLWSDKNCTAQSTYFLCQNYTDKVTPATKTTAKTPSTNETPTAKTSYISPTGSQSGLSKPTKATPVISTSTVPPTGSQSGVSKRNKIYIIVGVVGGVLVAVIIIVAVVCVRRRKREGGTAAENVNSNTGLPINSTHTDINSGDPQPYAEFTAESRPAEDSYDIPLYEEAAAVQTDKLQTTEIYDNVPDVKAPGNPGLSRVDPGHMVTEEGDVYAVPKKNQDTTLDDDLEIVDNEMYGAV